MPQHRRAFRYGEGKKPRIDLAKVQYDGKFSGENVEDVKTFCRICLLMISLSPALVSVTAFNLMLSHEANCTLASRFHNHHTLVSQLFPSAYMLGNAAGILLCLPIINCCVIPCFPRISIRARLGLGLALYAAANVITVIIHAVSPGGTHSVTHLGLLVMPTVLNSVAEILTVVSMLEFIYAQSPESMKGLLTGLFFFVLGLSSIAATVVFYKYPKTHQHKYQFLPYHITFTIIQFLGLFFYAIVATLHKNRQRPDNESYDPMIVEVHATSMEPSPSHWH